ncbi:hypothetical protein PybrP1_009583 [[Pythium] brassicae (nom. inval.)]|nr:hypothetical protein PybrP1_009583 [[Pythium] brassicae (nom. inval.)]
MELEHADAERLLAKPRDGHDADGFRADGGGGGAWRAAASPDRVFALGFGVNVALIAALALFWGLPNVSSIYFTMHRDGGAAASSHGLRVLLVLLATSLLGGAVSALWLHVLQRHAAQVIIGTLRTSMGVCVLAAVVAFHDSGVGGRAIGFLTLFLALSVASYYRAIRSSIAFAASSLTTAARVLQIFPALVTAAYVALAALGVWSLVWSVAVVGILAKGVAGHQHDLTTYGNASFFFVLLSFHWFVQVAKNVVHCVAAGAVGEWWFGSHDANTVQRSQARALSTSLGSICFGSLVVALLSALETVLLSTKRRKAGGGGGSSANACLECVVRLVKHNLLYFNKFAFCQVALYGKDFRTAGRDTRQLFRDRGWSFLLTDSLIASVLSVGCLVVGVLSGVIGSASMFLTMQCTAAEATAHPEQCETFNVVLLTFVACASIGYSMCAIVSSVLDSIVSTIFVCFAEDPAALQRSNPGEYARLVNAWAAHKPDLLAAYPSSSFQADLLSSDAGGGDGADDAVLTNLTLDGVQEGPYMLCKHADDLLGHHARQVFREKAASMRGDNSIYYYLKELMKTFGGSARQAAAKKPGEPEPLVLEAHGFRKLIASDPAFQCAVSSDQVDALFHRIEQDHESVIRHQDFVEFCLLDHNQLCVRKLRLTDNELTDTFRRLSRAGSAEMAPELFHAAISRELDVVLTSGELGYLMLVMDYDKDGAVKASDFELFVKDARAARELVHPARESAVVDIRISVHEADEIAHRREGYAQLFPRLQDDASLPAMYLWAKSAAREDGKAAIANIKYGASAREPELVAKGFTCLKQDLNRAGAFGKRQFLWLSYAPSSVQAVSEIVDLALTSGDLSDKNDARLWLPPRRGFKLVPGNLNDKSARVGVFLWVRRRRLVAAAHDLVDPHIDQALDSPRARSTLRLHIDDLEEHVRKTLRRNCPTDQDGALNFGRLFDEFDTKKARSVSKQAALVGIESFGIKMGKKDAALVWNRMNPFANKQLDTAAFAQFLELNDSEIDDVVNSLQRSMTTRSGHSAPNYRVIFQSYNALGDGKLSRADFQRVFAANQLNFTNAELGKVMQRFDVNRDGVVDYADFLRYVTGVCDASSRIADRVFAAAEEIRAWAIEKQNRKLARDGNIDSASAWKLLKTRHGLAETASLDHLLRQRSVRLDSDKLQLLRVLIAPATNGDVTQGAFHAFVNHFPKKIKTMVYELKKVIGPVPDDATPDAVFDRLNVEGNGKLSLVGFAREVNGLALEKNASALELKDFVYVVAWSGAICGGGGGAVLIDRFVATIRETQERRNMKNEFVTHYDSPQFVEGVQLLREEIKKCAKTLDGKFNYQVPFRLFDKNRSGRVVLSEFEAAIRELGVDRYLSDREVKSLMRRFDHNSSGAIDYDEFLRFNLAESTSTSSSASSSRRLGGAAPALGPDVRRVLEDIIIHERLSPSSVAAFCSSLKRMFGIIDKETTGCVSADRFVHTLRDMDITLPTPAMAAVVAAFAGASNDSNGDSSRDDTVQYERFCDVLSEMCSQESEALAMGVNGPPPTELLDLLTSVYSVYHAVRAKNASAGNANFDFHRAFGVVTKGDATTPPPLFLSADDLKEVLWAAGVRHPYLREELDAVIACFQAPERAGFDVAMFCGFLEAGPSALFRGDRGGGGAAASVTGSLDVYITRLQDQLQAYLSTGGDAQERLVRLFAELDEDGSGTLSRAEFVKLLQVAGFRHYLSPEDEQLLLRFLDADGDGSVVYAEFLDFASRADAKLSALVSSSATGSPPPSPPRAAPSTKADGASSPRKPTPSSSTGKQPPDATGGDARPHEALVRRLWRLNQKLRPAFPFEKYLRKYRCTETAVKTRVFEKVLDKFLATLTASRVAFSMHEMDVELLTASYGGAASTVDYAQFLKDLASASATADDSDSSSSSSSDDDDDELSCSSDDGASSSSRSSKKKQRALVSALGDAIQRARPTRVDLELVRAQVAGIAGEWAAKRREAVSENRIYKLLTQLAVRLRKKEAELLLAVLARDASGRTAFDSTLLFKLLDDALAAALGGGSSAPEKATGATEPPGPPPPTPTPPALSPELAEKIYRCFLAAAQQNISGRKLLEKCDPKKTGAVSLLELQTVLRLMGCQLTEAELAHLTSALGNAQNAQLSYLVLVEHVSRRQQQQQKQRTPKGAKALAGSRGGGGACTPARTNRPPAIQIPVPATPTRVGGSSAGAGSLASAAYAPQSLLKPPAMSREETLRLDSFLAPFFGDMLQSRLLACDAAAQCFRAYDRQGTGFVSADAFASVMRKLDIWPPADVSQAVLARFASASGDKFDYVDFCHVVSRGQELSAARLKLAPMAGARAEEPPRTPTKAAPPPDASQAPKRRLSFADPAKLQRSSVSLPSLETERSSNSSSKAPGAGAEWSCPVCFHTQTKATATCEICAAQDPASVAHELLLQCVACAFRNRPSATVCELCRLPLRPQLPLPSGSTAQDAATSDTPSSTKSYPKLPLTVPYDEGWLV